MDYLINEYIIGIKSNKSSMKIDNLTIDDDQSEYDYICTASLKKIPWKKRSMLLQELG